MSSGRDVDRLASPAGLSLASLPGPWRWLGMPPQTAEVTSTGGLAIGAGARTDWFIDPGTGQVTWNAPALVTPARGDWMLHARLSATHRATFDAAVLVVHVAERSWAKLCLERSPQGSIMVVSVVTRGRSDDCNSLVVPGNDAWLRVARIGGAFAFHHSPDGSRWELVRSFALDDAFGTGGPEIGFLAQSPTGEGCVARFEEIGFSPDRLQDIRSGA